MQRKESQLTWTFTQRRTKSRDDVTAFQTNDLILIVDPITWDCAENVNEHRRNQTRREPVSVCSVFTNSIEVILPFFTNTCLGEQKGKKFALLFNGHIDLRTRYWCFFKRKEVSSYFFGHCTHLIESLSETNEHFRCTTTYSRCRTIHGRVSSTQDNHVAIEDR